MKRFIIVVLILSLLSGIPAYMWGYSIGYSWGMELKRNNVDNERLYIKKFDNLP